MKGVYVREAVRKAHFRDGLSVRRIARELGMSRNTVRRILAEPPSLEPPRYQLSEPKPKPVVDVVRPVVESWLTEDTQRPRKQRHTARRIFERLRDEYGFTGSERAIRRLVAELRGTPKAAFLPLAFAPGEMAQVDWGEVTVLLAGQRRRLQLFVFVLNHSGAVYWEAFEQASQEAFFQGHAHAFEFLGGVPWTVTYDNLKAAVTRVLPGKARQENPAFVAFRSAYLFESRFCTVASGHEKGRVENMVKYAQRNLFAPVPEVATLAELNARLREHAQRYLTQTQARQEKTVGQRLAEEQAHLLPLPSHLPECCRLVSAQADKSALVQFETNRYSVPTDYAHQRLWLKAFVDRVVVSDRQQVLAVHPRLPARTHQESIQAEHYQALLARKPGGASHLRVSDPVDLGLSSPTVDSRAAPSHYPPIQVQPPNLSSYQALFSRSASA